jgi:hypothetical protein
VSEDPARDYPRKPEDDGVAIAAGVRPLNSLAEDDLRKRSRSLELDRQESDLGLSKAVGWGTVGLMAAQVVAVDAGFFWYAGENNWKMPSSVIIAWLGVGVVQVIGSVVLVVARHLFPGKGGDDKSEGSDS